MKFILIGLSLFFSASALADVYVIANSNVTLAAGDVKDVFTGDKQTAGSTKLAPVDNKGCQSEFLQKALSMDQVKYNAAWAKKSFQDGLTAPKVKGADADVVEFVKSTPGAVGYISTPPPAGVVTVSKF